MKNNRLLCCLLIVAIKKITAQNVGFGTTRPAARLRYLWRGIMLRPQ